MKVCTRYKKVYRCYVCDQDDLTINNFGGDSDTNQRIHVQGIYHVYKSFNNTLSAHYQRNIEITSDCVKICSRACIKGILRCIQATSLVFLGLYRYLLQSY